MNSKRKRVIWIIVGVAVLGVIGYISVVVGIDTYQFNRNATLLDSFRIQPAGRTLVVYFSRSGNTELMAYQIAEMKHAHIMNIVADDYGTGFMGWVNALSDARDTQAVITPQRVDLSAYDTIYIGSPIWLYSPAPPLFEFVRKNDFTGRKVILFNSLNSRFEQQYIDRFAALVSQQGGELVRHIYVIRGRMTSQLGTREFLDSVKSRLRE
jgi:flavodoxin